MTDEEWAFFSRYVEMEGRGRPPSDHRRVLDAIFLIALTGQPWRDLPVEFGHWGSVYRQFQRWTKMGVWEALLDDLETAVNNGRPQRWQIIVEKASDSAGGRHRLREKIVAARQRARRPAQARRRAARSARRG